MTDDKCPTMNQMILAKREETAKLIQTEHEKISKKHASVINQLNEARRRVTALREKSDILNHKSVLLSGEITQMTSKINEAKEKLITIECQIDSILAKQSQTDMVKDKEIKTFEIYYNKIKEENEKNERFWLKSVKLEDLDELKNCIETLREKKKTLEMHIATTKEKIIGLNATKLAEDCMILRKRNTAVKKRLVKKLKLLEERLDEAKKKSDKTNLTTNNEK
ncbi:uncharacterized protein LOC106664244 [Cimex lectularius]|uniref:Uncharacterized protein n=1 Tax=Cimex lectularius TaxID=79782 RepID=A0A8I6RJX8_CIMLE|nr:uncharacterized protein LOC106664244 [Cimex lectularius]